MWWKCFIFAAFLCKFISSNMQDFAVDVNDILSDKLMPASLMLLEKDVQENLKNVSKKTLDDEFQCLTKERITGEDGTFKNAFNSMGFHRQMINNFLCSKFMAVQILDDIQPKGVKSRLGIAKNSRYPEFMGNDSLSFNEGATKSHMLNDEGSYEYKNWLAKTTTLNDIYRNLEVAQKFNEERQLRRQDQFEDNATDYKEDYEVGDVTGFMAEKPLPNSGINSFDHFPPPQAVAGAKTGKLLIDDPSASFSRPTSFSSNDLQSLSNGYQYGPPPVQQQWSPHGSYDAIPNTYHHHYSHHEVEPSHSKHIGIKDLFDIALTTLAFLSFGMFIIQVFMYIAMAKGEGSVMLPMEMPTGEAGEVETGELEVRVRRSIEEYSTKTIKHVNDISKRTLQSMEAFVVAKHDRGQCLKKFICENNKFSRTARGVQKYTIPIFGISLSYISNKINDFPVMSNLENLQASIIGLGKGNCSIYKCSTEFVAIKRK